MVVSRWEPNPNFPPKPKTRVVVTGGTGFLARGILRRVYDQHKLDWDVTVYSRDEHKQHLCWERWPSARYVIGDVQNYSRLMTTMVGHDLVVHAGAIKFIPEAEHNVLEAISVNVDGSDCVFRAARDAHVQRVVAISTDKACSPLNVYGMTKALMERMVGEYASHANGTVYTACRYGNVVGSTGSVVPLFREQATRDKEVTVTDPDMTRYWISVDDAIDLILASLQGENGDILIPTPAAMRMGDLANLFDVSVRVTGVRPGEKKHEQLLHQQESVRAVWDGKYYTLKPVGTKEQSEPFMLSSNSPKVWLQPDQMKSMIKDSVGI